MTKTIKLAPPIGDRRPMPDEVYLVVCRDGRPHDFVQRLTKEYCEQVLKGIQGVSMTALDSWDHPCKPHRIQRYVPAPAEVK